MKRETTYPERLVRTLISNGITMSEAVQEAFRTVPRHLFLVDSLVFIQEPGWPDTWTPKALDFNRESELDFVYSDAPCVVQMRHDHVSVSCSAPSVIAQMLDDLDLSDGLKVLEIGTGTGYTAALIASLVGKTGSVCSVEIDRSFTAQAQENLNRLAVENVRVIHADGVYGYAEQAPYDRIVVHAGAQWLPIAWYEQVKPDGLVLAIRKSPNTQQMLLLRNTGTGLRGRASRFAYFGSIKTGENDKFTDFPFDLSSFRFPNPDPLPSSDDETFRLLESQDFLFYLGLQQPQLQSLPFMLDTNTPCFSRPRPVVVDALTNEVLFGPEYGSDCQATKAYGSAKLLDMLNHEKRRWQELGSSKLSDFLFTAVPLTHHNHTQAQHLPLSIPGELYYIPAPDGPDSDRGLDWVIRLVK